MFFSVRGLAAMLCPFRNLDHLHDDKSCITIIVVLFWVVLTLSLSTL